MMRALGLLLVTGMTLAAVPAAARTVLTGSAFGTGLIEPVWVMEHLLGLLAIGLWAGQQGGASVWQLPLAALGALLAAGLAASLGLRLPYADEWLVLSLVLGGILVAAGVRAPLVLGVLAAAVLAVPHGYAQSGSWLFWSGYAAGALLVLCAGLGLVAVLEEGVSARFVRLCGGGVALLGLSANLDRIQAHLP